LIAPNTKRQVWENQIAALQKKIASTKIAPPKKKTSQTNSGPSQSAIMQPSKTVSDLFRRPTRGGIGRGIKMVGLSKDGLSWLTSVFAAPDYPGQGAFSGIPDADTSLSLKYRHVYAWDLWGTILTSCNLFGLKDQADPAFWVKKDLLIWQPPVPGVAFYWAYVDAGQPVDQGTAFTPIPYQDFTSIFGGPINVPNETGSANDVVSQFRFAGNSIELINLQNAMSWKGSITAFKTSNGVADCKVYDNGVGDGLSKSLVGLNSFNNSGNVTNYTAPVERGVYMSAVDTQTSFRWVDVNPGMFQINKENVEMGKLNGLFTGMGSLESNCVRLANFVIPDDGGVKWSQMTVRSWTMIEYRCSPSHPLSYNGMTTSPLLDEKALLIYRMVVNELPVAVSYLENDSFWQKLLGVVSKVAPLIGGIFGAPGAAIGTSVGSLASSINAVL
jgi:hypothetical protein